MIWLAGLALVLLSSPALHPQRATPEAIATIAGALALAALAAAGPRIPWRADRWGRVVAALALIGILSTDLALMARAGFDWSDRFEAIARLPVVPPSWSKLYEPGPIRVTAWAMLPAYLLLALAILAYATPIKPRWRFPAIAACGLVLGAWVILGWPKPKTDVLLIQEDACRDLLQGRGPYSTDHPRIPWKRGADAPITRSPAGPFMRSFPYPPLSILAALPGYLVGDVRWSLLAATLGASALMVAVGRRSGLPAGHIAELAAAGVLIGPLTAPMLMGAYTEPFLFLGAVGLVLAMLSGTRSGLMRGLGLAAVLGLKQYGFLIAIPLALGGKMGLRPWLWAGLVLLAVNLPFLLWDPAGFKLGLVDELLQAPVRSICLPAFLQSRYKLAIPPEYGFVGFLAASAMAVLVFVRARGDLARCSAGASAVVLTFFFLGRAGHLHYFQLCRNLLWLAVLLGFAAEQARAKGGPKVPES